MLHSRGLCLLMSMLRYIPRCNVSLLYKLRFICSILALYCDITYFEILDLKCLNCLRATEARSQCADVMLHMLLE